MDMLSAGTYSPTMSPSATSLIVTFENMITGFHIVSKLHILSSKDIYFVTDKELTEYNLFLFKNVTTVCCLET